MPYFDLSGDHFISYSKQDKHAQDFAIELHDALESDGIGAWMDEKDIPPGADWETSIEKALQKCATLLYIISPMSVREDAVSRSEFSRALRYKKPVIPLLLYPDTFPPLRLENIQYIDFTGDFAQGYAKLHRYLRHIRTEEGELELLRGRLGIVEYDIAHTSDVHSRQRAQDEAEFLRKEIARMEQILADPEAAARRHDESIQARMALQRQPADRPFSHTKFINQPPLLAPDYFQDRYIETRRIAEFLHNPTERLLIVEGRGGNGKTALASRLLKALEAGRLPDNLHEELGPVPVGGIVYLSALSARGLSFPHLFEDLLKLLPAETARELDALYKSNASVTAKMRALLAHFTADPVIVLLDNFEDVTDIQNGQIADEELREALRTLLSAPHHTLKAIITTRVKPRKLMWEGGGRLVHVPLDEGLQPQDAANVLRALDRDGRAGIRDLPPDDARLRRAHALTHGFPRALEALQAVVAADYTLTLDEALDNLEEWTQQAATPQDYAAHIVEKIVGDAYSRLDAPAQRVMQALAVYGRPVPSVAVDFLLQPYNPTLESTPTLRRLANMHFARADGDRFYLHPVDRAHALAQIPPGESLPLEAWVDVFARLFAGLSSAQWSWILKEMLQELEDDNFKAEMLAMWGESGEQILTTLQTSENVSQIAEHIESSANIEYFAPMLRELVASWDDNERRFYIAGFAEMLNVPVLELDVPYTLQALRLRAADYFRKTRKPREQWKTLDDLAPQLNEIALRTEAGDYDTAADVLTDIDFDYLLLWGHARLVAELHERLYDHLRDKRMRSYCSNSLGLAHNRLGQVERALEYYEQALAIDREIGDKRGEGADLTGLGNAYYALGQVERALEYYEQALAIAREIGDKRGEGADLTGLGIAYSDLGQVERALEYYEQALAIAREIGDKRGEGNRLGNMGIAYSDLGQVERALEYYEQALAIAREIGAKSSESIRLNGLASVYWLTGENKQAQRYAQDAIRIADEIGFVQTQHEARMTLALAQLQAGELSAARETVEKARQYDFPENNHAAAALHGVILRRLGKVAEARAAFEEALALADALIAKTEHYYEAHYTRGLAWSGLALSGQGAEAVAEARRAYRAARAITAAEGIVRKQLLLFDALAVADEGGELASVRRVLAGEA